MNATPTTKIYFDPRVFAEHAETLAQLMGRALPGVACAVGPAELSRWQADARTEAPGVVGVRAFLSFAARMALHGRRCRATVDAAADLLVLPMVRQEFEPRPDDDAPDLVEVAPLPEPRTDPPSESVDEEPAGLRELLEEAAAEPGLFAGQQECLHDENG